MRGANPIKRVRFLVLALSFVCTVTSSFSYTAYVLGRKTYPGCTPNEGNTCWMELDLPGPPELPISIDGEPLIDYNTETHVSGSVYVALPVNPNQYAAADGCTVVAIWYTTDGSPCPLPNQ